MDGVHSINQACSTLEFLVCVDYCCLIDIVSFFLINVFLTKHSSSL